jgi:hypothetical protein
MGPQPGFAADTSSGASLQIKIPRAVLPYAPARIKVPAKQNPIF